jgi:hypothetical protein
MHPRFVLPLLIIAALLWPLPGQAAPAAEPLLFVSFVRLDSSTAMIYPPQQLTLAVQVATDSPERIAVWAWLNTTPELSRDEGHYHPWMNLCDEQDAQDLRCPLWVSATGPVTFTLDVQVRASAAPGVITPTLEAWPFAPGRPGLITKTLPLTVIEPQRVYLPRVVR